MSNPKPMTPKQILSEAKEMAKHYPGDRLRLTGQEVLDLVGYICNEIEDDLEANSAKVLRTLEALRSKK
jgi:hypothetical protein